MEDKIFTDKQNELLRQAAVMRREAAERAGVHIRKPKTKVSPEEYRRRLEERLIVEERTILKTSKQRIEKNLQVWADVVGPRFANATIENPRMKKIVMEKVDKIEEAHHSKDKSISLLHNNSLVLAGDLGIGKTWTAYGYSRELVKRGLLDPSRIVQGTESALIAPIAAAGYERPEKMLELLKKSNKLFLLDEMGRAALRQPDIRQEIWYAIINHAYENFIPLIITTNKSTEMYKVPGSSKMTNEIEEWIGEAAYDRLKYMADIVIPAKENQRGDTAAMFNKNRDLGLAESIEEERKVEESPFGSLPPKDNTVIDNSQRRTPQRERQPDNSLRPMRRG